MLKNYQKNKTDLENKINIIENDTSTQAINKQKYLNTTLKFYDGTICTKLFINNGEPTNKPKEYKTLF